jgi:S-disulfanyl-L-cysteine oxidoreductase SoxD
MFRSAKVSQFLGLLFLCSMPLTFAKEAKSLKFEGIGRDATSAEVLAWDIDVRPDFKGLPKGSGTVTQGQEIWESRCASCHGTFGESNEVFTPIIGGTTTDDIKNGRVASLADRKQPQRTTVMKVPTVSSLWDYIYRAMPWNAPRSMSVDETFAVLAYILNLAEIVPDDYVLNSDNIAQVQNKMPNRDGMTLKHGLWSVKGVPDTQATACINNCSKTVEITSVLPDYARNANGNIALQNREYGPYRGIDSTKPPLTNLPGEHMLKVANLTDKQSKKSSEDLFKANNCSACHANNSKLVGPSLSEISKKYQGQNDAQKILVNKVRVGGAGVWGSIPMPAHPNISNETIDEIIAWILKFKS